MRSLSLNCNRCRYVGAENVGGRPPAPLAAELPAGLLSWIKPVWCYPEPEVIDLCGLDVAVFFRLMQLGEFSFCSSSIGVATAILACLCWLAPAVLR
jgi:hypothetical protein